MLDYLLPRYKVLRDAELCVQCLSLIHILIFLSPNLFFCENMVCIIYHA